MISLKRNSYGIPVEATGLRSRSSSKFVPNKNQPFRISRSKFNDFLTCMRCFYMDRVMGLVSPSMPGWTLNETVDLLLKKEFDLCRELQIPHRMFDKFGLVDVVPFNHPDIDLWRDSLHHGLRYRVQNTNIVLHGGIDDIWFDQKEEKIIVVEYKSQSNNKPVRKETYLAGTYRSSYKIQVDFYTYLRTNMDFAVSPVAYFYVCNANRHAEGFNGQMIFEETIVPYEWNMDWIPKKVSEMIDTLNSHDVPDRNYSCENCAYAHQRGLVEIGD